MAEAKTRARTDAWGSVRALPSGRFQARYVGPDGERYTAKTDAGVSITFGTKTDARAWLKKIHRTIEDNTWESPDQRAERLEREAKAATAQRFGLYAETWVAQRRNRFGKPLGKKTASEYRRQLKGGLAEFAEDSISDITAARVRAWHAKRAETAATSAGAEARLLRAILNTAIIDEIILKNPVASALTMSSTGIKHRPPTLGELGVMLETVEPRFKLAILLGAYGGMRLSEWRALRRSDLQESGGRYVVSVTRQAQHIDGEWVVDVLKGKDDDGARQVTLPAAATPDVDAHLERYVERGAHALLFAPGPRSEFLHNAQFYDRWDAAREAAGVRFKDENDEWVNLVREHDLRAFAGTMHAQSGATIRETMEFLGHSTTVAAMAYQKTTGRDAELADRMPFPASSSGSKAS